jgi:hypothetical protein
MKTWLRKWQLFFSLLGCEDYDGTCVGVRRAAYIAGLVSRETKGEKR